MKHIILFSIALFMAIYARGQNVSINTNGDPAHPSAMLDITSNDKGLLIPRMTTPDRLAISNPAQGLLVYDLYSRSFWFHDGSWRELASGGGASGPAGGDLSGSYPTPNVVKIQNLDVAFGVPFDKQVLKWDAIQNQWKGKNDSLFLPYNVSFGSATSLFGITNNNTSNGSSAILGRSGNAGSGITPANSMGVWGDNSAGIGVVGTSNTGIGTFGFSFSNHGVYGYSTLANFAGVKGSHANAGGIGVMGEIQNSGTAILGSSTGATGKAGVFQTTNTSQTDTTLLVTTQGLGTAAAFMIPNVSNTKPAVDILHAGNGNGIKLRQTKTNATANALDVLSYSTGIGIYSRSENSTAGKFENTNATNVFPVMVMGTNSLGTTLSITSTHTGSTGNVVDVVNNGLGRGLSVSSLKGNSAYFAITDATATNADVSLQHQGIGRGLEISLTKNTNTQAGLWVNTAGTLGITSQANAASAVAISGTTGPSANDAIGVKGTTGTSVTNGIGVLGQAGASDPNGIGVKGIAGGAISGGIGVLGIGLETNPQAIAVKGIGYTHNEDVGSVTGINMTDGVGVYGESLGFDGIAVAGTVGNTSNHSVAAVFKNTYDLNNRAVMEILSNGKGNGILIDHTSLSNTSPLLRMRNSGSGQFLRFENGLGDIKTTLSKEGNLVTDGTITVLSNKGIVRNTTGTQLRMEIMNVSFSAGSVSHYDEFNSPDYIDVTFSTAFSATPAVSFAQFTSGGIGPLTMTIQDVTTTGCTIELFNYTGMDWSYPASTVKLVIVGAE